MYSGKLTTFPIKCPKCSADADGFTDPNNHQRRPSDGNICICAYCLNINQYKKDSNGRFYLITLPEDILKDIKKNSPESYITIMRTKFVAELALESKQKKLN